MRSFVSYCMTSRLVYLALTMQCTALLLKNTTNLVSASSPLGAYVQQNANFLRTLICKPAIPVSKDKG